MSQPESRAFNDPLGRRHHHLKSIQIVDTSRVSRLHLTTRSKLLSKITLLSRPSQAPTHKIVLKLQPPLETNLDASTDVSWGCDTYIDRTAKMHLEIHRLRGHRKPASVVTLELDFSSEEYGDDKTVTREESGLIVTLTLGTAKSGLEIAQIRGDEAIKDLESKAGFVEKLDHFVSTYDPLLQIGAGFAELHPAAKAAASLVTFIFKKIDVISKSHKALGDVIRDVNSLLPTIESALQRCLEANFRDYLERFVSLVIETARKASRCYSSSLAGAVWTSFSPDEITRMEKEVQNLKQNMSIAGIIAVEGAVAQIGHTLTYDADVKLLDRLTPPEHCSYDPDYHHRCIPGTRLDLLKRLGEWARDASDQSSRLYWLYGVAGSGKSCVAASVASDLHNANHPSRSFFCKRDIPERRDPRRLIQSLAHFLAFVNDDFRDAILSALQEEHAAILGKGPQLQFKSLLETPLSRVSQHNVHAPIVFIVDALDECDESATIASFLPRIVELAPWLKLIVTSRPLDGIAKQLSLPEASIIRQDLFQVNAHDDILKYIRFQCSSVGTLDLDVLEGELTESQIQGLAGRAQGLFIWIDTVLKYVSKLAAKELEAVDDIINSKASLNIEEDLDVLYLVVLNSVCGGKEEMKKIVRLIIGLIFVISRNEPLPAQALHAFIPREIGVMPRRTIKIIRELASVLTEDNQSQAVRVCHPSFLDFIGNQSRSKEFWTDPADLDTVMATACLEFMKDGLKFNICHLESSYLPNSDVKDLKDRISRYISRQLQYSSMYWLDHISRSKPCNTGRSYSEALHQLICTEKSLFWIEVMSLIGKPSDAVTILQNVPSSIRSFTGISEVLDTALDLHRFVSTLYTPIAHSAPHIYVSALPWTPSDSTITRIQSRSYAQSQLILEHRIPRQTPVLRTLELQFRVLAVAYSPDGSRIVSASMDMTLRIWDAGTGLPVGEPLRGHSDPVWAVAYSPDGSRIVSASEDKTLRIWDADTGLPVGEPLQGHSDYVWAVAYSPDGSRIVSGSADNTLQIWDADTGLPVGEPLQGHSNNVTAVAYSPDGSRIVSGSEDKTLRIWDAHTGLPVGESLQGHSDHVWAVAYSPDGSRIVSGSADNTLQIWDAHTGLPVGEPLQGHSDYVWAVAYSPDGSRIVSGSADNTLQIWDADTGLPVGEPLQGHSNNVTAVAYSPDGSRIVSGSEDKTLRIWDAHTGLPVGESLQGHSDHVWAVAYSPDGSRIVSGSGDQTLRIWDAHTGLPLGEPLQDHSNIVTAVAYSPDGSRIVSGSEDKTLRIWDAGTGLPVGEPLQGHSDYVRAVAYSLDGSRIVSGSDDKTLHIWDAGTGLPVGEPLQGHSGRVLAVAYSPDGSRIVSGSDDKTLRIWAAHSGLPVGEPLQGHSDGVWAVAYSPDGSRIVSGSFDMTLRIWDAGTGLPVGEPLQDHSNIVTAVAYSPDGSRIVSGSDDKTLRIWDAGTGLPIGEPLQGHLDHVWAVAYSPDGSRIVSGSSDNTLRIWDTHTGLPVGEPLQVHSDGVWAVAYSPDGSRIVSGSEDKTLRIWDAYTGLPVGEPLQGHSGYVVAVAYAPDGNRVVSGSFDMTLRIWDAGTGLPVGESNEGESRWDPVNQCFVSKSRSNTVSVRGVDSLSVSSIPSSVSEDGWVRCLDGGLLLWIPQEHRISVCDKSLFCIPKNAWGHPLRLNWKNICHGRDWTQVRNDVEFEESS